MTAAPADPRAVAVDRAAGAGRRAAEVERLALVRARAAVPLICGDDIQPAPARGAFRVFEPLEQVPGSLERQRSSGHLGRHAIARADVFDRLPGLTPGQVAAGRRYRDLVERYSAGLSARSTLSSGLPGGGGGGDLSAMDCHLMAGRAVERCRREIGPGAAMVVRRLRPTARGAGRAVRATISDRALVDAVCLGDQCLTAVLVAHGWAPKGEARGALVLALAATLERLRRVL